jgi:DNA-binding NarL/FixJ family response regulator
MSTKTTKDTKMERLRILLADDHLIVRVGFSGMISLRTDFEVIAEAEDGIRAVELYRMHRPDVALLDLRMPRMSGLEALAEIRREFSEARVIMLTTYSGEEDIRRALDAGASGYLTKEIAPQELARAIETVARGERYLPESIKRSFQESSDTPPLTARELEVLGLLIKGLNSREIGTTLACTERTAKFHIGNILTKLNASDRAEAVAAAYERGILHAGAG